MEAEVRTKVFPLPRSLDATLELVRRVLTLPSVMELQITEQTVVIHRRVADGEEVLPAEAQPADLTASILLQRGLEELRYRFVPGEHIYLRIVGATGLLSRQRLNVVGFIAPSEELLAAALGLEPGALVPTLFGAPVYYTDDPESDKLLVLGGRTPYTWSSATFVALDLGD